MRITARSGSINAARRARCPLVICPLAGLLFALSLLAGVLASPVFEEQAPRSLLPARDPTAMLARWRQSVSRPENDPPAGTMAPRLSLRAAAGPPLDLAGFRGKKVALLFVRDGAG